MSATLPSRIRAGLVPRLRTVLLGSDPDARYEHLRVTAALGIAVAGLTALIRLSGVLVSPVVWDAFLVVAALTLLGLPIANAYWRGGLLVGYGLVFVPVAVGLTAAVLGRGPFAAPIRTTTVGGAFVGLFAVVVGTVGDLVGRALRWIVDRRGWET